MLFTATPDISTSSENINSTARVFRLSFRFLWLWLFQNLHRLLCASQFTMLELFQFHLTLCVWKLWKGREQIRKIEYLENKKDFFDEIKNIFRNFWNAFFWWKIKSFSFLLHQKVDASFNLESIYHFCESLLHLLLKL